MEKNIQNYIINIGSTDDKVRYEALQAILGITEEKVGWVYEVWDGLLTKLDDENSYQRSIAIMVLCNLAKSDVENRLEESLDRLLAHTKDEKFITSRQCIQNIWKVGAANKGTRKKIIEHLEKRFRECADEAHYNLLRLDMIQAIRYLYDAEKDEALLAKAREMLVEEKEEKYRKKYEAVLKGK